jgi:hypothetical protein
MSALREPESGDHSDGVFGSPGVLGNKGAPSSPSLVKAAVLGIIHKG